MNKELENKVNKIKSLLPDEQLKKDIVEINYKENPKLIDYLNEIGTEEFKYVIEAERIATIQEVSGEIYLWYKKNDGYWMINLYHINKIKY